LFVGFVISTADQSLAQTGGSQTFEKVNSNKDCASKGSRQEQEADGQP
jgi:hypothetical protein